MKKQREMRRQSALELQRRINNAHDRATKSKNSTIVDGQVAKDEDPGFKKIANYLLHSDVRKHNRYCPCCRQYEEGNTLSITQMSEFLEYIK